MAATLYFAVEGVPPFGLNENPLALLHKVASGEINPPTQAGPLTGVLLAMLAAAPEDRLNMLKVRGAMSAIAYGRPDPSSRWAHRHVRRRCNATALRPRRSNLDPMRTFPPVRWLRQTSLSATTLGVVTRAGAAERQVSRPPESPLSRSSSARQSPCCPVRAPSRANSSWGDRAIDPAPHSSVAAPPALPAFTGQPGAAIQQQLVQNYLGLLPDNATVAWQLLDPSYQATFSNENAWAAQWQSYQSISVSNLHQESEYYFQADLLEVGKDGTKTKQRMGFSVHWDGSTVFIASEKSIVSPQPQN